MIPTYTTNHRHYKQRYRIFLQIWKLDTNNISSHIKFPKRKPSNPPKKGDKATPIEKNTVAEESYAINVMLLTNLGASAIQPAI